MWLKAAEWIVGVWLFLGACFVGGLIVLWFLDDVDRRD